jgi:hypothetical protein
MLTETPMFRPNTIYRLFLEMLARDIGLATAYGMAAGMRAVADTGGASLEDKLERALDEVFAGDVPTLVLPEATADPASPPRRGPGRPRKEPPAGRDKEAKP